MRIKEVLIKGCQFLVVIDITAETLIRRISRQGSRQVVIQQYPFSTLPRITENSVYKYINLKKVAKKTSTNISPIQTTSWFNNTAETVSGVSREKRKGVVVATLTSIIQNHLV